jgi:hypothetical protein
MDDSSGYSPHHPWYYRENKPLPVEEIEPADASICTRICVLSRIREKLEAELKTAEAELQRDIEQYLDFVENGEDALSS